MVDRDDVGKILFTETSQQSSSFNSQADLSNSLSFKTANDGAYEEEKEELRDTIFEVAERLGCRDKSLVNKMLDFFAQEQYLQ